MKRYNNLFDKIVNIDNLYLADKKLERINLIEKTLSSLIRIKKNYLRNYSKI